MLNYKKRVLLLKPVANHFNGKCLLTLETTANSTAYSGELFNFNAGQNCLLTISLNGEIKSVSICNSQGFSGEFSGVCSLTGASAVITENQTALCYGEIGTGALNLEELLNSNPLKLTEYNDDLIATENYYEDFYEQKRLLAETTIGNQQPKQEEIKKEENCNPILYESKPNFGAQNEFFNGIKQKIEELFNKFSKNSELESLIPESEFCKISYDGDRFYSVGTISENGCVKYLCYAVEGEFSSINADLRQYFRFIPRSPFAPYGSGYYLVFQRADTGETLTFNN